MILLSMSIDPFHIGYNILVIECNIYTCTGTVHKYNTCTCTYNVQCTMYMYNST